MAGRFFRTCDSDKEMFLSYFRELHRHFGRVHVIMDSASFHTAKAVRGFVLGNPDVRVIYLPTATPELSAMEQYWHQSKRDILVSEYYGTLVKMRHTPSEYLSTSGPKLDVKYISRKSLTLKNFGSILYR